MTAPVNTRIAHTADGTRIAYDVSGKGPALILLHGGFVQNRRIWHHFDYVSRLRSEYTVITLDLRGHGESDGPLLVEAYRIERFIDDICTVADACGARTFRVWGFSLGAVIAFQLAAVSRRVVKVVGGGGFFGSTVRELAANNVPRLRAAIAAREDRWWHSLSVVTDELGQLELVDPHVALTLCQAMVGWPLRYPSDLRCPVYLYVGQRDQPTVDILTAQRDELARSGVELDVLPGLNHFQEITDIDRVFDRATAFLGGTYPARRPRARQDQRSGKR